MLRKAISLIAISLVLSSCGGKGDSSPNNPPTHGSSPNNQSRVDPYLQFIAHSIVKLADGSAGEKGAVICASLAEHYDSDLYIMFMADLTLDNKFNYFNTRFFEKDGYYCLLSQFFMVRTSDSDYSARSACSVLGQKFNTSCLNKG